MYVYIFNGPYFNWRYVLIVGMNYAKLLNWYRYCISFRMTFADTNSLDFLKEEINVSQLKLLTIQGTISFGTLLYY